MTSSIEKPQLHLNLVDMTQDIINLEKNRDTRPEEVITKAYHQLDGYMEDTLLESGVYDESTLDEDTLKELGRTKRSRTIVRESIMRVLEGHDNAASMYDESGKSESQELHAISLVGAGLIMRSMGLKAPSQKETEIAQTNESTVEAPLVEKNVVDNEITIDRDLFRQLLETSKLDVQRGIQGMANGFIDIYYNSDEAIDKLRSKKNRTDGDRQAELNAIGRSNLYARFLGDIIQKTETERAKQALADSFSSMVERSAHRRSVAGGGNNINEIKSKLAQMMTGIKLEVASIDALKSQATDFGWIAVEESPVNEDVQQGADAYITRADGVRVPVDFKSKNSFQKQRGVQGDIEGVKVKRVKGREVIVVDSQTIGLKDHDTGRVPGVKGFTLYHKRAFAETVNAAVESY